MLQDRKRKCGKKVKGSEKAKYMNKYIDKHEWILSV